MIKTLNELKARAQKQKKMTLVVTAAQDEDVLLAVAEAKASNLIDAILVGDEKEIREIAKKIKLNLDEMEIIDVKDFTEAAERSAKLIKDGRGHFIMKGKIDTSIFMKALLNKEFGLRTDRLLSHVMVYEVPTYHKLLLMTDGGMNITPSLEQKEDILLNSLAVAKALGNNNIMVSALAAKEKPSEKMIATLDGQQLKNRGLEGKYGDDVYVEGPIAFDLAVSKEAAKIKGYQSPVVGETDILLVPTIEVGNGIGKALTYMARGESAGIIMGAKVPIVLVSRADSALTKFYSIALGSVISASV